MDQLEIIGGLVVRHGLTTLAGALMTHGYLGSSTAEQFVSACMLLVGVGFSWWKNSGQAFVEARLAKLVVHVQAIPPVQAGMPTGALVKAGVAVTEAKKIAAVA